ncbi:MAG TPA: LysR family transcriptional regulator [Bacteroidales bacterium]|jgi:molybdate transport system regulatory protein|nr:LysR family transcriptional regulator [Bacteroidales bacterium]HNV95043.1 LysR family transcriptional regulator [Bacteroidales bacterium]HOU98250.1 LysR family transcriptional regulator [Bacteroidales bacterium]
MNDLKINFKIWLETNKNDGILGDGKWKLLKTISETGSLNAAMKKLGLTYRKTWDNLNKIEKIFGFQIIERQRGGKTGGKTVLTPQGQAIVDAFNKFHEKYDPIIIQALENTLNEIKQRI